MNCSQFGEVAHDVDRAGALAGPLWVETISHADECPSCSSVLDRVRALNAALRGLAEQDRGALPSAQVEAALRTIFRQRRAMQVHARAWRRWIWAGAAAVIVAAVLIVLTLRPGAKLGTPLAAHAPARTNSPAIQPPTATQPREQAQAVPQQSAGENTLNSPRPAQDSDAESAEDFVPLPDSLPLLPAEEASVVRVRMRRGSLNAFGLQINEERAADLIQVEFLVAEDGTPRAVRYVR
jgi:hypothetical protein